MPQGASIAYSAPEVITIIAAAGALIAAVGVATVNVIVALRTTREVKETGQKADKLLGVVQEVHTLTNSNLSAVKAELATAASKIESLLSLVQDLKAERDKAALQQALHTPAPRTGTEERRSETRAQFDTIEELLTDKGEQIDTIETTVVEIDQKVTPPAKQPER